MRSMDIGQVIRKIVWGRLSNCWKVRGHLTGLNFRFEDKLNMRSKDNFLRLFWSLDKLRTIFEVGFRTMEKLEATGLASKFSIWGQVKYEVQRQFFRLSWSMNNLRTIFEVGSQTEAESMEASKTKVKINGGRRTSVPLGNLTQSDLRLPNWGCKPWSLKN